MQRCVFSFDSASADGDNATGRSGSEGVGVALDTSGSAFLFLFLAVAPAVAAADTSAPALLAGIPEGMGGGGGGWGAEAAAASDVAAADNGRAASTLGTGSCRTRFRSVRMRAIMKRLAVPAPLPPPLLVASAFLRTQSGGVGLSLSGGSTTGGIGGLTMALMETSGSVGSRSLKRLLSSAVCWDVCTVATGILTTDGVTSATGTCFDCFVRSSGEAPAADPVVAVTVAVAPATFCMVTEAAPKPFALKLFLGGDGAASRLDMARRHCAAKMS